LYAMSKKSKKMKVNIEFDTNPEVTDKLSRLYDLLFIDQSQDAPLDVGPIGELCTPPEGGYKIAMKT